ncbi:hypothetical protein ACQVTZ_11685, partial [Bacillus cereus]|uniref:hypothetical protein n=1 Tax=Bacillus cereus TaxID=1396 RepID=UPI003D64E6DA
SYDSTERIAHFFILGAFLFISLIAMGYRQHFGKNHAKSMQDFIHFFGSFSNKGEPENRTMIEMYKNMNRV